MRGKALIEVDGKTMKSLVRAELDSELARQQSPTQPETTLTDVYDFGDASRERIQAAVERMGALLDIINDERLREWVKPSAMRPGHLDIADAVFEAAARMPLRMSEGFNVQRFVRKVGAAAQAASRDAAPQAGQGPEAST